MIHDLPLEIVEFVDDRDYYCAIMKIPSAFAFPAAPIRLKARRPLHALLCCAVTVGTCMSDVSRDSSQEGIVLNMRWLFHC